MFVGSAVGARCDTQGGLMSVDVRRTSCGWRVGGLVAFRLIGEVQGAINFSLNSGLRAVRLRAETLRDESRAVPFTFTLMAVGLGTRREVALLKGGGEP